MTIEISGTPTATNALPTILFDNLFADGTITASTEATGFGKANAVTETTYDQWSPTALPATISSDLGAAASVDCAAVIAHDCFTKGNTVLFQRSSDGSSWTTVDSVVPTDNSPILFLFDSINYRYYRFRFENGTVPFVGVVMVGARFTMPAGVVAPYTPMWAAKQYELLTSNSLGGHFLGNRIIRKSAETSVEFVNVSESFAESDLRDFMEHYNQGKAFVFASGPSVFSLDVGYCWRTQGGQIRPTFDETGSYMSVSMEVQCYVE